MSDEKLLESAKRRKIKQREYYLKNKYKEGKYYKLEQQLTQKDAINKVLTEAVEYYSSSICSGCEDKLLETCFDGGTVARQALEKVKV